ncbi:uncharacterized protein LOC107989390 isoform X1 [Cynoglossus semilaevis]|uniref:uncharacterized protein LOC107989390 isoform X1 n=1 Tax=Cynoglossus semilaevis TaxID=244447 RepID=UPI0007DC84AC|nr:uncharacterized protein LOC107989390 isoform X1 [Cynoglossus semilaevis]
MSFIEKSVARLDQLDRLEALALELGKSHFHYNASPKYYSYVGAEFICAVQPILKERWTPELEEAWKVRSVAECQPTRASSYVGVNQQQNSLGKILIVAGLMCVSNSAECLTPSNRRSS